jgi:microcompartment protein CcmK/EutM
MKLARVTGTVEATVKDPALTGQKLLLTDVVDGGGKVTEPAVVAVDGCGAGVGDQVLLTFNSAARMPSQAAGAPVDATIIAVVDRVTLETQTKSSRRKP